MKITSLKFILSILIVLLLSVGIAYAQPGLPNAFFGYVTVNGQPATDGTVVVAKINGVQVASTTTSGGKYGYPVGFFYIDDPHNDRSGDEIKFFVSGVEASTAQPVYFCNGCIGAGDDRQPLNFSVTVSNPPVNPPYNPPNNPPVTPPTNNTTNQTSPQICQERWICSEWSACSDGIQTRACNDENHCGTNNNEPFMSQPCPAENRTEEEPEPEATTLPEITGFFALLSNPIYSFIIILAIVAVILLILSVRFFSRNNKKKRK